MIILFITAFVLVFASVAVHGLRAQSSQAPRVKQMTITGEIAKSDRSGGYIIRGKVPAEIFTILNPEPTVLDELVKTGRIVPLEVRIVSGDNVEIKMIDGKEYSQEGQ